MSEKYISVFAAIQAKPEFLNENHENKDSALYAKGWNACNKEYIDNLLDIPAEDVRPVVYCRDCIHRPYSSEPGKTSGFAVEAPDRECKCPCFNPDDGYYSWIPEDDFFCADGERCEGGTP